MSLFKWLEITELIIEKKKENEWEWYYENEEDQKAYLKEIEMQEEIKKKEEEERMKFYDKYRIFYNIYTDDNILLHECETFDDQEKDLSSFIIIFFSLKM